MAMNIETIDTEIRHLQQEAVAVEHTGPTFDEVWPQVERQLTDAEALFRRHGPQLSGMPPVLPEHLIQQHQAAVGAALVANKKAVLDSERARIKAQTEHGISAADKRQRIAELRAAILKAAAKRELELRKVEGAEFMPRPVHPELASTSAARSSAWLVDGSSATSTSVVSARHSVGEVLSHHFQSQRFYITCRIRDLVE